MDKKQFEIDQLRKDKIIFAVETCATILLCLLAFQFSNEYLASPLKDWVNIAVLLVALAQKLFQAFTNISRWRKIKQLEKLL